MRKYNPYIIIFTLLLETMFLGIVNVLITISNDLTNLKTFIPFSNVMLMVLTIFVIVSLNQSMKNIRKEMEGQLLKSHLQQMEDMVRALHIHHQEHSLQVQTLQAMLNLQEYKRAGEYVDNIACNYSPMGEILNIGEPAITSLLYGKQKIAEAKGVQFDIAIKCSLDGIGSTPPDLCTIIGQLLDNAMEACLQRDDNRRMAIEIKYEDDSYRIYVINNGPQISDENKPLIFALGFSTAASKGRGFGLYQVQQLVESYHGKIEVITQPKTTFIVTLPGGEMSNAKESGLASGGKNGEPFAGV